MRSLLSPRMTPATYWASDGMYPGTVCFCWFGLFVARDCLENLNVSNSLLLRNGTCCVANGTFAFCEYVSAITADIPRVLRHQNRLHRVFGRICHSFLYIFLFVVSVRFWNQCLSCATWVSVHDKCAHISCYLRTDIVVKAWPSLLRHVQLIVLSNCMHAVMPDVPKLLHHESIPRLRDVFDGRKCAPLLRFQHT